MDEFEEKLSALLGNPAEMEKITRLAAQFLGGGAPSAGGGSGNGGSAPSPAAPQPPSGKGQGGAAPAGQGGSGGSKNAVAAAPPAAGGLGALSSLAGLDPALIQRLGRLLSQAQAGSDKTALLRAMGPYLSKERREKMEKAIRFASIAKLAGIAMREAGGEGHG